ncbi:MAG: arginine--tRNA ligase [Erysipelotrichaceae bacterium]|jgi:arginyl-tRNA synthetase|nr:arginine--tRNA ligase [Erysipelotrichaceae bacterium]
MDTTNTIKQLLRNQLEALGLSVSIEDIQLTIPKSLEFGDFSTNAAMIFAKKLNKKSWDFALELATGLQDPTLVKVVAVPPGFINFFVSSNVYDSLINEIYQKGPAFGKKSFNGKRINVEFVSANPTGELHLGHARGAAVGDAISRILENDGYEVTREYYVNDAGNQINNLALSLRSRYLDLYKIKNVFPEDGYHSLGLIDIAKDLQTKYGDTLIHSDDLEIFRRFGKLAELKQIKKVLRQFRIKFDVFTFETKLRKPKLIKHYLDLLRPNTYVLDEALFLKTSAYLDDKDRPIQKSNGEYTYLLPDIIYHDDKARRGYDQLIDVLGADHHGYINRMKSALMMLGYPKDLLEIEIIQMVRLIKDGVEFKMSKRSGNAVSMEELMNDVGVDAVRYFFLEKAPSSHLDFDLTLAMDHSTKNPLYYIEYAHARLFKMIEKAQKVITPLFETNLLTSEVETALLKCLNDYKKEVEEASRARLPSKVTNYLQRLSSLVHQFYVSSRVLGNDVEALSRQRLALCIATRIIINNGLNLLGIKAYNNM